MKQDFIVISYLYIHIIFKEIDHWIRFKVKGRMKGLSQKLSSVNRKVLLDVKMVTYSVNRYCLSDVLELACIGLLELMAKFSGLFQVSSLVT